MMLLVVTLRFSTSVVYDFADIFGGRKEGRKEGVETGNDVGTARRKALYA